MAPSSLQSYFGVDIDVQRIRSSGNQNTYSRSIGFRVVRRSNRPCRPTAPRGTSCSVRRHRQQLGKVDEDQRLADVRGARPRRPAIRSRCYDNGVGTSSFKPLAVLGGALGWGLKRNVATSTCSPARNYGPADAADRLYAFGFSRGAFTIRVLIGLIEDQGLITGVTRPRARTAGEMGLPRVPAAVQRRPGPGHAAARAARLAAARLGSHARPRPTTGARNVDGRASPSSACGTRSTPTACRSTR